MSLRILYIGMNFAPEQAGIGPLSAELAARLVQSGHEVTVATTFPHYPAWKVRAEDEGVWFRSEEVGGARVERRRIYVPRAPGSFVRRVAYDLSFSATALLAGLRRRRFDVVVAVSPPITAGLTARLIGLLHGAPTVLVIQDLVSDLGKAVGLLRSDALWGLVRQIEALTYRVSDKIVVISEGFAQKVTARGVAQDRIVYLPNWIDTSSFSGPVDGSAWRRTAGLAASDFVAMFTGTMGMKQGLDSVVSAAQILASTPAVKFALVGAGPAKEALQRAAGAAGTGTVLFPPFEPRERMPTVLNAADVLLQTSRPGVVETVLPSKLVSYMAAGRPVVLCAEPDAESARLVRQADCGIVVRPGDAEALAGAIETLRRDPQRREEMGQNARRFVVRHFDREVVVPQYISLLESLGRPGRRYEALPAANA